MIKIALRDATELSIANLRAALLLAEARGVPCPKLLWHGFAPAELDGRPMLIQEFIAGEDGEEALPDLSVETRERFFLDWGTVIGKLHSVPAECFSNSISQPERCRVSWIELVDERLARLIPANIDADVVPEADLHAVETNIRNAASSFGHDIAPALVHCDLYPPNTLVQDDRFRALLDFEHAKFMDPVYDFVKLHMWVFEPHPDAAAPFWSGYTAVCARQEHFEERLRLCIGLELLAGFPYWKRRGEQALIEDYRARLDRWLASA